MARVCSGHRAPHPDAQVIKPSTTRRSATGLRSTARGPRPTVRSAADREEELKIPAEKVRSWFETGIVPSAVGVAARSSYLAGQVREALQAAGVPAAKPGTTSAANAVQVGTMHGMKGLEFQAVAVIGVEDGMVPALAAVTAAKTDELAHHQDLLRERCGLFVACTRARDQMHLYGQAKQVPAHLTLFAAWVAAGRLSRATEFLAWSRSRDYRAACRCGRTSPAVLDATCFAR